MPGQGTPRARGAASRGPSRRVPAAGHAGVHNGNRFFRGEDMETALRPGIRGETEMAVERRHLADEVGSGLVRVFSTAMMIAGMESTAVASVQDLLRPGETTVGVHVDVSHSAATPLGMRVRFFSELVEVSPNGRGLTFRVSARDESGLIGEGLHRRVVVDREKFESRTRDKAHAGAHASAARETPGA